MRFRAKIVHVVVAGLPLVGCDKSSDASKTTAKAETTKTDATKSDATKQDPKQDPKQDAKQDAKQDPVPDPKVPIVIEKPEDIPVALAGAPIAYDPPPPPPPKGDAKAPSAPAPAPLAAPAAAASASAAEPAPRKPTAITLAHNHPPDEQCKQLTREEVEKALADLQK